MIFEILKFICVIAGLVPAAYSDYKTKTIPVFIFPLFLAGCTVLNIFYCVTTDVNLKLFLANLIIGGTLLTIITAIMAKLNKMGWADVWMFGCVGFSFGIIRTIEITIISCAIGIIWYIAIGRKKGKEFPLAPFVLLGTIIDFILTMVIR